MPLALLDSHDDFLLGEAIPLSKATTKYILRSTVNHTCSMVKTQSSILGLWRIYEECSNRYCFI